MDLKRVVLFILIMVIGIPIIALLVPPAALSVLERADLATWTGLEGFVRLIPFFLIVGLVVGDLMYLFGKDRIMRIVRLRPRKPFDYNDR